MQPPLRASVGVAVGSPLGEDVAEIIERIPARLKVIRHVRPKFSCQHCQRLVQAPAPARPIARGACAG